MRARITTLFICMWLSLSGCMVFVVKANADNATTSGRNFSTEQKPQEAQWTGHISYVVGYKRLSNEWSPAEDHLEFGLVDFDFRRTNWPISIAAQLLTTTTPGNDIPDEPGFEGDFSGTYEFNLGLRKVWENSPRFHPFLGGGPSIIGGSTTEKHSGRGGAWYNQEEHDADFGFWAGTGFYWVITESFHLGMNAQYSWAEIELFDKDLNAGGIHLNMIIGYHW